MKMIKKVISKFISLFLDAILFIPLSLFQIAVFCRNGKAIGEQVCFSAVPKNIFENYGRKSIVLTSIPQVFENNPHVVMCIHIESLPILLARILPKWCQDSRLSFVEEFRLQEDGGRTEVFMKNGGAAKKTRLIDCHSMHFKKQLNHQNLLPEIYFTKEEEAKFLNTFSKLPQRYALIQAEGKTTFTENKKWSLEYFQTVINSLPEVKFVQVGMATDKKLENVIDLRGKTNLRELFYLTSKADFVLSTEGLFNHLTAAFNTRNFVIFSGFLHPELSSYPNTIAITNPKLPNCAPCWQIEPCHVDGYPCMMEIKPNTVTEKINSVLNNL